MYVPDYEKWKTAELIDTRSIIEICIECDHKIREGDEDWESSEGVCICDSCVFTMTVPEALKFCGECRYSQGFGTTSEQVFTCCGWQRTIDLQAQPNLRMLVT